MLSDKWVFFQLPDKPSLNTEEVKYWVTNLNKIIKAGLEFEFNLKSSKGFCKGTSPSCPCRRMTEEYTCWKKCFLTNECKKELGSKFDSVCAGELCSNFIYNCVVCNDFVVDCTDCKYIFNKENDPDNVREFLRTTLKPSRRYGKINAYGVHSVVCDGSLLGSGSEGKGAEVITVGRRVDYWEFFNMTDKIITSAMKKGAYVNERCSIHVHLLNSYYDLKNEGISDSVSELERPLPQLVMANFHQLCRRFQNAITWMSMGLNKLESLTRWEKYRVSIFDVSPVEIPMNNIIRYLEDVTEKSGGKYGWVNYMYTGFNNNGDLSRFHVEMRVMDGILSPSVVTALTCLFYALVIKAVEISRYGLLEVGSKNWVEQTRHIKKRLLNNRSSWSSGNRKSDTSKLSRNDIKVLKEESEELLTHIKHILMKIGPAYDVLEKLYEKPVAFHRCEGLSWKEIEEYFAVYRSQENILEQKLSEIIDFRLVLKCTNEKEWKVKVSKLLKEEDIDHNQLNDVIEHQRNSGLLIWSDHLGTMLRV